MNATEQESVQTELIGLRIDGWLNRLILLFNLDSHVIPRSDSIPESRISLNHPLPLLSLSITEPEPHTQQPHNHNNQHIAPVSISKDQPQEPKYTYASAAYIPGR